MNFNTFKTHLANSNAASISIKLPNGSFVPAHFHLTEISHVNKTTVDCGGAKKQENTVVLQLWVATDTDHRLTPQKVLNIIDKASSVFIDDKATVEIEYQTDTIGKYAITFYKDNFELVAMQTACPAPDLCGIPAIKQKLKLTELGKSESCCSVDSGSVCC